MAEKTIKTRVQNKYDTTANWGQATFAPLKGETIVYATQDGVPAVKYGDGTTPVGQLPFAGAGSYYGPVENRNEIFNDYANNYAGTKAFDILAYEGVHGQPGTYTLDSVEGLNVGDVYTVHVFNTDQSDPTKSSLRFDNAGEITAINGNVVSVSYLGLAYDTLETDVTKEEHSYFRIAEKPDLGTRYVEGLAHVEGRRNKALGYGSHAEGDNNIANGAWAHVEGKSNYANYNSHAEGRNTQSLGESTHTEGGDTIAKMSYSHAEGFKSQTNAIAAHAEGEDVTVTGRAAHGEGYKTTSSGPHAHTEGELTQATTNNAHAEGYNSKATASGAHAEGANTQAKAEYSHTEGRNTVTEGQYAHAEGDSTKATGLGAHSEGQGTTASAERAHAEGTKTTASGGSAHAEGDGSTASVWAGHAEGKGTNAHTGAGAHAEGYQTEAGAQGAHAEGRNTKALKAGSHAEGDNTTANGDYSHAEGYGTTTTGSAAHAEGSGTTASGAQSHAEGNGTTASGSYSHAEGQGTKATNNTAHAEGYNTQAKASGSHAEGGGTIAGSAYQHVEGLYNIEDTEGKYIHIAGNGTSSGRSNAYTLDKQGNAVFAGDIETKGNTKIKTTETTTDKITSTHFDLTVGGKNVLSANTYPGTVTIADILTIDGEGAKLGTKQLATQEYVDNRTVDASQLTGTIPASLLPSYVDDVIEGVYVDKTTFYDANNNPITPESGKIYVSLTDNKTYRWGGTEYAEISASIAIGETSSTAYRGDRGKVAYEHSQTTGNAHNMTLDDLSDSDTMTRNGYLSVSEGFNAKDIVATKSLKIVDTDGITEIPVATEKYVNNITEDLQTQIDSKVDKTTTVTNEDVDHVKYIPDYAGNYATINSIGGMTRKCKNLWSLGDITANTSPLIRNISLPAGTYTISLLAASTDTDANTCRILLKDVNGESYYWGCERGVRASKTVTLKAALSRIEFDASSSSGASAGDTATFTNIMLNEGSTALPYEPYFEGLRSALVTEVESKGANLLNPNNIAKNTGTPVVSGESVTVNGFIADVKFYDLVPGETYHFSAKSTRTGDYGGGVTLLVRNANRDILVNEYYANVLNPSATATIPEGATDLQVCLYGSSNDDQTTSATYTDIMLNKGTIALPYTPYVNPVSISIPEAVQALEGYGWGIDSSVYNYVDFENKKFVQRVGCVDLGALTWEVKTNSASVSSYFGSTEKTGAKFSAFTTAFVSNNYQIKTSRNNLVDKSLATYNANTDTRLCVADSGYSDAETFKAAMSGVMLYYELETPIITDISDILLSENHIRIESNGSIEFVNEYEYAIPNSITIPIDNIDVFSADLFIGDLTGKASQAERDGDGNIISETYAKNSDIDERFVNGEFSTSVYAPSGNFENSLTVGNKQVATKEDVSLSKLGVTATAAELNRVKGVTENIQTQLDRKIEGVTTFIDDDVAYTKKLPQYTSTYAQLNSIGGASVIREQIIYNFSYQGTDFYVPAGMTWDEFAYDYNSAATYYEGNTYGSFYDYQGDYIAFQGGGFTLTTGPLVEDWVKSDPSVTYTTAPGGQTLLPTKVTAIEIKGANMIPFPYTHSSMDRNGLKIVVNEDGTITAKGTSTVSIDFVYSNVFPGFEHGKTYRIASGVIVAYKNAEGATKYGETSLTWDDAYTFTKIYYYFAANRAFDVTYYPMINEGTVLHPYAKYSKETISIPQEVTNLPGYGAGNPNNTSECNSIEWADETVKYVQRGSITNGEWVALSTPVVTDITSQMFERNIKVECCGYLTFINDSQTAVPSSVTIHTDNVDVLAADVFVGDLVGKASKAEYAEKDAEGNVISETYLKSSGIDEIQCNSVVTNNLNTNALHFGDSVHHQDAQGIYYTSPDNEKFYLTKYTDTDAGSGTGIEINSFSTVISGYNVRLDGSNPVYISRMVTHDIGVINETTQQVDPVVTLPELEERLANIEIPEGAQAQADWNQTDSTAPDYIKNKPQQGDVIEASIANKKLVIQQNPALIQSGGSAPSGLRAVRYMFGVEDYSWENIGQIGPETQAIGWRIPLSSLGITTAGMVAYTWTSSFEGYSCHSGAGSDPVYTANLSMKAALTFDDYFLIVGSTNTDYGRYYTITVFYQ